MAANSTSFKPGQVANPRGRPRLDEIQSAKLRLRDMLPKALDHLDWMLTATDENGEVLEATRERGMNIVFDRNLGKVIERKELTGADGAAIKIEDNTPAIRLLLQAALPEPKTIEGEAE